MDDQQCAPAKSAGAHHSITIRRPNVNTAVAMLECEGLVTRHAGFVHSSVVFTRITPIRSIAPRTIAETR